MNRRTMVKLLRRLDPRPSEPPEPPRIRIPDVEGAGTAVEPAPIGSTPSRKRIVIPDYDDRWPPGTFW
jgi:hypothetical protein